MKLFRKWKYVLLLKALSDEDFDYGLKLETQLKILTHIVDEKQVGIKSVITIMLSLNASQKLLVSELLKLVKLILTVPITNAVSENSCSQRCADSCFTCDHLKFKGTLMQISKPSYVFVLILKKYPVNFALSVLTIIELYTRKICEMFVYKYTETIEYVKN